MAELLLTLGASAGTAGTIGSIATVMGPVLQVAGAISGVQAANAQSAEYERSAAESKIMASIESERMRRHARQVQSQTRAGMAEAGVLSGTSLGLLDQNAVAQELDALTVEFRGEQQARGYQAQAGQSKKGYLDVFSTAISSFGKMDPLNLSAYGGTMAPTSSGGVAYKSGHSYNG